MTKTVSLSDEAYDLLRSLKRPGESFSDVALRLGKAQRSASLAEFAGAWKLPKKAIDAQIAQVRSWRDEGDRRA